MVSVLFGRSQSQFLKVICKYHLVEDYATENGNI